MNMLGHARIPSLSQENENTPMSLPKPYEGKVLPEWIDHNGHMNVAYYVLAIDESLYDFFGQFGLNQDYRDATGCSTFTGDLHIYYKREIHEGDAFTVKSTLLGFDDKRIRYMSQMFRADGTQPSDSLISWCGISSI